QAEDSIRDRNVTGVQTCALPIFHFYRKKQRERYLEFEAYEIENIEKEIASLYNEEKTDLSDKLSTEQLDNIQEELEELKNKEYSLENQQRLDTEEEEYLITKARDE